VNYPLKLWDKDIKSNLTKANSKFIRPMWMPDNIRSYAPYWK